MDHIQREDWNTAGKSTDELIGLLQEAGLKSGCEGFDKSQPSPDYLNRKVVEVSTLIQYKLNQEHRERLTELNESIRKFNTSSTILSISMIFIALVTLGVTLWSALR